MSSGADIVRLMIEPARALRYSFVNDESELRSGWRLVVFAATLAVVEVLLAALAGTLGIWFPGLRDMLKLPETITQDNSGRVLIYYALSSATNLASILIASLLCAKLLERRSLASVGFKFHRRWGRDFALGLFIGGSALAMTVAIEAGFGAAALERRNESALALLLKLGSLLAIFLMAAAFEELLARGFAFQALLHNVGPLPALAVTSLIFGLLHIANQSASAFSTFNTVLAGVWLGVAYLKTRSLWFATAMHASWNFATVFVFGLPVSGITDLRYMTWLKGSGLPPHWVSGGAYGPEGGAAATVILVFLTLGIWRSKLFRPDEEMINATRHGARIQRYTTLFESRGDNQ